MAWVVADRADAANGVYLTLSEEVTGVFSKALAWPASVPGVPLASGSPLQVLGIRLEVTTTITSGSRRPVIEVWDDESDFVFSLQPAAVAPANATTIFEFMAGFSPSDSAVEPAGTVVRASLPDESVFVMPGGVLSILADAGATDTADTVVIHVRARVPAFSPADP